MRNPVNFRGPYLKTERANHHINDLERIFKRHIEENKKALTPRYNRKPRSRPIGTAYPPHTPTILGDALHNLRAALDHAYCELVKANGHRVHERSLFPIVNLNGTDTWQSRRASMEGHEKIGCGPGAHMIDVIGNEIQPYAGGKGALLADLHALDVADKHQILLPTDQMVHLEDVTLTSGERLSGLTLVTSGDAKEALGFEGDIGLDPKRRQKATIHICFGRGQPLEGQPIIPTLRSLKARVDETLRLLEHRAKGRPAMANEEQAT